MDAHPPFLQRDCALFVDFDGTLVELADHPDRVVVPARLHEQLRALERQLGGALAIITGRSLASLDRHLAPLSLHGAGVHGGELRLNGAVEKRTAVDLAAVAEQLQRVYGAHEGLLIENKGTAVAFHYRHAIEFSDDAEHALRELVRGLDVAVVPGKFVFEARPRGIDKGGAVREFMRRAPFAGRRPVFAGDDRSDEDAIAAVQALGGIGIKIGEGDSVAHWRIASPRAFCTWLELSSTAMSAAEQPKHWRTSECRRWNPLSSATARSSR